jgi:hypothetical protein
LGNIFELSYLIKKFYNTIYKYVGIIKLDKYKFYNTDEKDILFEELKLPEKNIKQLKLINNLFENKSLLNNNE